MNMRKKLKYFFLIALSMSMFVFSSCSKNDDEEEKAPETPTPEQSNFTTPTYENVSAKYEITNSSSQFKSFELTASGNYIIVKNGYSARAFSHFFGEQEETTRSTSYGNIIYGKFTKKSDTEFELEGFGTIVIKGGANNACSLIITQTGGSPITLPAQRSTQTESSTFTNQLCRTWSIGSFRFTIIKNGQTLYDGEYATLEELATSLSKMAEELDKEEVDAVEISKDIAEVTNPQQVVFTKSGTYMVFYSNTTLAVSTWKWEDEANGKLRYSWNYQNMYDDDYSGVVDVSWRGIQLTIKEGATEYEDGDTYTVSMTYYLNEVK